MKAACAFTVCVAVLLSSAVVAASVYRTPAAKAPAAHPQVRVADQAASKGEYREAVSVYNKVIALPGDSLGKKERAGLQLERARTFFIWSQAVPADAALLDSAAAGYVAVKKDGDDASRALAANGLAVIHLSKQKPDSAVRELRKVPLDKLSQDEGAVVTYNLARGLTAVQDTAGAVEALKRSIRSRPDNDLAVVDAFSLLRLSAKASGMDAAAMGAILIDAGRAETALEELTPCLERWGNEPAGVAIFGQMVRAQARLGVDSVAVARLITAGRRESAVAPAAADLDRVAGGFAIPLSPANARALVPAWVSQGMASTISDFLKALGDARQSGSYRRGGHEGDIAVALACYAAACELDPSNTQAALYEADLLLRHRETGGAARPAMLDRLVRPLFAQKTSAYRSQNFPVILRLHVVLASIFEGQGRVGLGLGDSHSAIFQLQRAIEIQGQGLAVGIAMPAAPGLHQRLADIYSRASQQDSTYRSRAAHEYVLAAREFAADGERTYAQQMLDNAGPINPPDVALAQEIRAKVAMLPKDE